ncbi:SusC/RagA family TonB-linked outer membrane protein [Niabella insulamsoli]|uniref:SusC/RagA family TonB-linked outer membrane protein n=1 Tax=Niabella insulamsoli TaxID=3144874 RepID=UPI0031FC5F9C
MKGRVVDEYGHSLPGIEVREPSTNRSVVTGDDGSFEIQANGNSALFFSGKDYDQVVQRPKAGAPVLVVRMHRKFMTEVDTIDVLYDKKSKDLSIGAVSTIYTSQLSTTPASLYAYALAGRLPGLYTQQVQGFRSFSAISDANSVNDLSGVLARTGLNAFSDNTEIGLQLRGQSPVVVVDGIQRNIFSLDPESIESISVLKDGLSTIALGQRSSRGVMLVTTKKPKAGPPQLSFSAQVAMQEPTKMPRPVDAFDYAYLVNEALQNEGRKTIYSTEDLEAYKRGDNPYRYPNVNWYDEVMKERAPLYRYNLNLGGGGRVARYMVSLNYMNQQGLLKISNPDATLQQDRYLINSKVDIDVTKYFQVGVQLFGRIQDGNQPGATLSSILDNLLRTPANAYPIYNPDGSFGGNNSFQTNLKAQLDNSGYKMSNERDIMANLELKYNFDTWLKGLWAKFNGNLSVQSATLTDRALRVPVFQMQVGGDASDTTYARYGSADAQVNSFYAISNARYWYAQGQVGYSRSLPQGHDFTGYLMADMRRTTLNFDLPGTATNYMLKGEYNFKKKYMLEAALNYSGYDRYPPGRQFGWFYAAGAGWNIAEEAFIKERTNWLNQLKLRANYAHTGNGVDNSGYFIWRQSYSQSNDQTGIARIDHVRAQIAMVENGLANETISWEDAHKLNVGLDIGLFNNHLLINADYYRDLYFNLLQVRGGNIALLGTAYPAENIGKNLFYGSELAVTYQNHIKSFNYFVTANASLQQSKVVFMDEQRREYAWNERTGFPVNHRFGYIAEGFFQTQEEVDNGPLMAGYTIAPGDIKYKDLNNDGVIDQFDLTAIGTTKPLLYYGLTTGFNYRGLGFSVLFQGVKNRNLYIDNWNTEILRANGQVYGQMYEQLLNRWTPETAATATYPRLKANGGFGDGYTLSSSSFWMHSGDYWRIKNLNLQYTLPYKWTSGFKVAAITAFANAQNLFTWAAYDRVDPEVGYGAYPLQRVYNIGINVKF